MGITANTVYPSDTDHDGSFGTDVRKATLLDIATNNTTTLTYGTASGTTRTVDPFTGGGQAGDASTNYGWAVNFTGSTDGMESTANNRRIIPAGAWTFKAIVNVPAASGVGGSIGFTPTARVYRVASNTGNPTRTLLFSSAAPTQSNTSILGATDLTYTWNSAAQPQYIIEPGETIHFGFTAVETQVVGTLGSAVNVTIIWRVGGSNSLMQVPTGFRTLYDGRPTSETTVTTHSLARQLSAARSTSETTTVSETFTRVLTASRALVESLTTTDALTRQVTYPRATSDTVTGVDSLTRLVTFNRSVSETTSVTHALVRQYTGARSISETLVTNDSVARQITYGRSVFEYPTGVDPDFPVVFPLKHITGAVYDHETGFALDFPVRVDLYRDRDNRYVQMTTCSPVDGSFTFLRDLYDPNTYYYVAYYTNGLGVQVHGISDRGITPVNV